MVKSFRIIGYIEGISLLVLLFIAMPLKYSFGMPMAVKIVGWIHGILFLAYLGVLYIVAEENAWSGKKMLLGFIAGVLPFGTFLFDRLVLSNSGRENLANSCQFLNR